MKKSVILQLKSVLLILLTGLILLSCQNGVQNEAPHDFQKQITEIKLLSATDNGNRTATAKFLLPYSGWENNLNEKWDGIGIQVNDEPVVPLYAAQNQNAYYWERTGPDADVYIRFGHFRRNSDGSITWANEDRLSKNLTPFYTEKDGKKYIGITFRDTTISPIIPIVQTKLQAIISASTTETLTGLNITFDGSGSTSQALPLSRIVEYFWDFGDWTNSKDTMIVKHSYQLPGTYTVSLTVKDNLGNSHTAQIQVKIKEIAHPGDIGDDIARFSFDFQNNLVRLYFNFSKCQGGLFGKSNAFGNFNGVDQAWYLFYEGRGLSFDAYHFGWGYIDLPMTKSIMQLKYGFSSWYYGTIEQPNFSQSNFDHMKSSVYFNGQDLSVIIYSSGQVVKGP